jgi:ferritin
MVTQKMLEVLNSQIQAELFSSNLYLAMAAYCERNALKGFGHWLATQAEEERGHALKIVAYLCDRGGKVEVRGIEASPNEFGTILQVFEKVLEHERHVTALIHRLFETAQAEKDYATQAFLQWFISEQVEEEARAGEILDKLRLIGDRPGGPLYLDKEYGKRPARNAKGVAS